MLLQSFVKYAYVCELNRSQWKPYYAFNSLKKFGFYVVLKSIDNMRILTRTFDLTLSSKAEALMLKFRYLEIWPVENLQNLRKG